MHEMANKKAASKAILVHILTVALKLLLCLIQNLMRIFKSVLLIISVLVFIVMK